MKKTGTRNWLFAFAITMLLLFVACDPPVHANRGRGDNRDGLTEESERSGTGENSRIAEMVAQDIIVATVNGVDISASIVSFMMQQAAQTIFFEHPDLHDEERERTTLEEAVRLSAMFVLFEDYAARHNLALTAEDLNDLSNEIEDIFMFNGGEEEFTEMLVLYGIFGREHFEQYMRAFAMMEMVMDAIVETPALFAEFEDYLEDAEEIEEEEVLAAKHILITVDDFDSEEDAMLFAREIWARAVAGEDFDELAVTYSQDPGLEWSPDGYTFTEGVMVYEFEQATRELAIGEISEPVSAFHGIHIILRVEPDPNPDNIMRSPWAQQPLTLEQRMGQAIFTAFESRIENAEFVFLPVLYTISDM